MPELSFNRIDNIFNDVSNVLSGGLDELSKWAMPEGSRTGRFFSGVWG